MCDRVAIFDHGRIVALDSPEALIRSLGAEELIIFNVGSAIPPMFEKAVPKLGRMEKQGERVIIHGKGNTAHLVSEVVSQLAQQGIQFRDLRTEQPTLENVFLNLIGRAMKD